MTQIPPDYHSHTSLCKHAQGKPIDYANAAKALGLPALACTDHCPTVDSFDLKHRMDLDQFPEYLQWVEEAQQAGVVRVLLGVEADYYPGCETFLHTFLESHPLDLVLGSVHYLDFWNFEDKAQQTLWDHEDTDLIWTKYFQLITEMAETGLYDVASHLDLPKRFGRLCSDKVLQESVLPALDAIAKAGMAIEINTSGTVHEYGEMYPHPQILAWACERNIGLCFGSDAHLPQRVGDHFGEAVLMAKEAGYRERVEFNRREMTRRPLD